MSGSGSYATTPNFALKKPVTGADDDLWGTHWNQNADTLDATLKAHGDAIAGVSGGPFLPLTGGNLAGPGNLTVAGLLTLPNLPTSNAGLPPGTLWNNGGFVCVA